MERGLSTGMPQILPACSGAEAFFDFDHGPAQCDTPLQINMEVERGPGALNNYPLYRALDELLCSFGGGYTPSHHIQSELLQAPGMPAKLGAQPGLREAAGRALPAPSLTPRSGTRSPPYSGWAKAWVMGLRRRSPRS